MKDNWSKRTNYLLELTNNECHTLSRFNCYTKNTLEIKREKAVSSETKKNKKMKVIHEFDDED